jgi:hypothetical protein
MMEDQKQIIMKLELGEVPCSMKEGFKKLYQLPNKEQRFCLYSKELSSRQ